MDFAALPPEINSGRMYSGPGAGPMLAAAAAWDGLATELYSTAASYGSVVSELTDGPWLGPASASMAAAAAPYVAWLSATAVHAEQTAGQATAAAAAFEAAFAMTVPPPLIAANRAQLMALTATNFLGQNTPAITATEAHYGEMWAQDAAAMYGYAGTSRAASTLTPFTPPVTTTNLTGLAGQAAVAQAVGTSNTQTVLSQLTSAFPTSLQGILSPLQSTSTATSSASGLTGIVDSLGLTPLSVLGSPVDGGLSSAALATSSGAWGSASQAAASSAATQVRIVDTQDLIHGTQDQIHDTQDQITGMQDRIMGRLDQLGPAGSAAPGAGAGPAPVSAGLGRAASVGGLSVPEGWAAAAPPIRPVVVSSPTTSLSAVPEVAADFPGSLVSEMALAGMVGRATRCAVSPGRREQIGATPRAHTTPPQASPGRPVPVIAAELRELAELRDSGILTDEEFSEQKRRLLGR